MVHDDGNIIAQQEVHLLISVDIGGCGDLDPSGHLYKPTIGKSGVGSHDGQGKSEGSMTNPRGPDLLRKVGTYFVKMKVRLFYFGISLTHICIFTCLIEHMG